MFKGTADTVVYIMCFVFTIMVWRFYHKKFIVWYLGSASQSIAKELMISFFIGMLLTVLTLAFWWVTAIILLLAGIITAAKEENPARKKAVMAKFVVYAIIISVLGIWVLSSGMGDEENQEQTEAVIEENMQGNDCIISNKFTKFKEVL